MPTYLAKDYVIDTADTDFVTVDGFDVVSTQYYKSNQDSDNVVPEMITLPAAAVPITGRYRITVNFKPSTTTSEQLYIIDAFPGFGNQHYPNRFFMNVRLNGYNTTYPDYSENYLPPNGTEIYGTASSGQNSDPTEWENFEWGGVYLTAATEIGIAMYIRKIFTGSGNTVSTNPDPTFFGYLYTIKVELLAGPAPTEGRIVGVLNRTDAFGTTLASGSPGVQQTDTFTTTDDVAAGETVMMITCDRNFSSQPFSSGHENASDGTYWNIDGYPYRNTTNPNPSGDDGSDFALGGLNTVTNGNWPGQDADPFINHLPSNELQEDVPSGTDVSVTWGPHTTFGWGAQLSTPNRIAVLLAFNAKAGRLTVDNSMYAYTEDTEYAQYSSNGLTDTFDSEIPSLATDTWQNYWSPYYTIDVSDEDLGIGKAAYRRYYVVATVAQQHGSSAAAALTVDPSDGWIHIGDVDTGTGTAYGIKLHIYWRMFTNGTGYPRFRGTFDRAIGWGWVMTVQQCLEEWALPSLIHLEGARHLRLNL